MIPPPIMIARLFWCAKSCFLGTLFVDLFWMETVQNVAGEVPTVFLGNKSDLEDEQEIVLDDLQNFASRYEKAYVFLLI